MSTEVPSNIDLLIAGGGSAGAALAGIVARDTNLNVLLLEAGPDYGPYAAGRWPADLLDALRFPQTHDWGYSGLNRPGHRERSPYDRARVLGGCSSHNGCVEVIGHRRDYDGWAELGNPGWAWDDVAPAWERAKQALRIRIPDDDELTPFHRAFMEGAVAAGIPRVHDLDDPDDVSATGISPVNIIDGVRWNTAFAYIDPVREKGNLTILANALVDRVVIEDGRAIAVIARIGEETQRIEAGRIVLSAGAYGSPAILMRSGIGDPDDLNQVGVAPRHELPGVGKALTDHPLTSIELRPTDKLAKEMARFSSDGWTPDEQTILKTRSPRCTEAFDLHLYGILRPDPAAESGWHYAIPSSTVAVRSSGAVRITSSDPEAPLFIDHGYFTDPGDIDRAVLVDGLELAREIAANLERAGLIRGEIRPGPAAKSRAQLEQFAEDTVRINYHPACSCRMGPLTADASAVVDADGNPRPRGPHTCDVSISPTLCAPIPTSRAVMGSASIWQSASGRCKIEAQPGDLLDRLEIILSFPRDGRLLRHRRDGAQPLSAYA
ncbi:MAG: GMC family oxidoreductase [Thermomicrobiales bacterium]